MAETNPRSLKTSLSLSLLFLSLSLSTSDPDPLQDYCVADQRPPQSQPLFLNGFPCINPNLALPSHFSTSALAKPGDTKDNVFGYNVTRATVANLPGLNTMGLTMARVDIGANGLVPPHAHPRASEVTVCLKGSLLVGFVDTSNRLFTQQLRPGDSFVFPRGLIHFLYNLDDRNDALAIAGMSSQNPGTQIASVATFVTKPMLPDVVLEKAFRITGQDVMRIRRNLGG